MLLIKLWHTFDKGQQIYATDIILYIRIFRIFFKFCNLVFFLYNIITKRIKMMLTQTEIYELLFIQQIFHYGNKRSSNYSYISNLNEDIFKDFISQYRKNTTLTPEEDVQLVALEKELKEKLSEYSAFKNFSNRFDDISKTNKQKVRIEGFYKEISEILVRLPVPINYYDDNFWSLFNFKLSNNCENDWKTVNSTRYIDKDTKKDLISFLAKNKRDNFFNAFTNYLLTINHFSYKYIDLWYKEAIKSKNKNNFKNQSFYPKFNYHLDFYKRNGGLAYIKTCEILSLFEVSSVNEKLLQLYKDKNGDMISQEKIKVILDKLGIKVEFNEIDTILEEKEHFPVVNEKILSIQNIAKKGKLNNSQVENFKDILLIILNKGLKGYAAELSVKEEKDYYVVKENYRTPVLRIKMITSKVNNQDACLELNDILKYYTSDFLVNQFKSYVSELVSFYSGKEKVADEFLKNLETWKLHQKLNTDLEVKNNTLTKMKI